MSDKSSVAGIWQQKLHAYLALARISNSPTVVSDTLAGAALVGLLRPSGRLGWVALAMVLLYTAGMYLNDLCDYAIDRCERSERPLPSGIVPRSVAIAITIILFGCGEAILLFVGWPAFVSGLLLIALIIIYDCWHENNPLSPLIMALCRLMVYVTAFLSFSPVQSTAAGATVLLFPGTLMVCYLAGLTYIAKTENKLSAINVGLVAILFLPTLYFSLQLPWQALPLVLLFTLWTAYSVSFVYRSARRQIGRAVGQLIAGIALLDTLVMAMVGSWWGVAVGLGAFILTLFLQRYVKGT